MDRTVIDFPHKVLVAQTSDWHLDVRGRGGNESVSGVGQVIYGLRPRWVANLDFSVFKRHRALVWGSFVAQMRGRVNLVRIHLCDPNRPIFDTTDVPHDDDAYHDDDTGYAYDPVITLPTMGVGDTSFTADPTEIRDLLEPGHFFSIEDYLYRVTRVYDWKTYHFDPPLRQVGTYAYLQARVIVAFDADEVGRATIDARGNGDVSLSITEWVNR